MQLFPALIRACSATLFGCLLAPALALAADGERTPLRLDGSGEEAATQVGASGGGLVRTIVGLAVVIGVIFGLTWVLKQVKSSRRESVGGSGLSSLATLPLGTNRSLHLVRAGDEIHLVGAGEHGVTPIRTYSEAEARALGLLEADRPNAAFGAVKKKNLIDQLRDRTVLR
ncbi:MAG: flagellar biosynthetic protein FliO [Solirubrobacteraceae bacterium]